MVKGQYQEIQDQLGTLGPLKRRQCNEGENLGGVMVEAA